MHTILGSETAAREVTLETHSPEETYELGRVIGKELRLGNIVALVGELGAGKTYLTKGISLGLGVRNPKYVSSPTFMLIHEYYGGRLPIYHIDLYRIQSSIEIDELGLDEYFSRGGVAIIEWAEKILELLPNSYLRVELRLIGEKSRRVYISEVGSGYSRVMERLLADEDFRR